MGNQIEEVKSRTDILALVGNYVSLKKAGRNYKGLCPFHSEKTPSFMVNPERGIFKCFGCNEGGDSLTFYQKIEGVDFGEALKVLSGRTGVVLKDYKPSPVEKEREVILKINQTAADFFHYLLTKHVSGKKALSYLKARGVSDKSVKDWSIGYAPDSWEITEKFLEKKKFAQFEIIKSGLALPGRNKGSYDRFRKRIMFPIRNVTGAVVGFSGRIFGDGEPKYLNSPDSLVFNKSAVLYGLDLAKTAIKKENTAVLVEGNLDVISSHQIGVNNVVAPLGTALTEKQLELVRRFGENLAVSFDRDSAGFSAAKRAIDLADNLGLNVKVVKLAGKDPDEMIKKDPNSWRKAVGEAISIYDYLIDSSVVRYGTDQGGLRKITNEIAPLLSKIDNRITRSHYERLLATKLGVEETAVESEVTKRTNALISKVEDNPKKEQSSLEKYLMGLIIQSKLIPQGLEEQDFSDKNLLQIWQLLKKNSVEGKLAIKNFENQLPDELAKIYEELTLLEIPENLADNQEKTEREIRTCLVRLKELNLRTELQKLNLAIKQAEIRKNATELDQLAQKFSNLSEQLSKLEKEI